MTILRILFILFVVFISIYSGYINATDDWKLKNLYINGDECHQWFSDNCQMNLTAQYCTSNAQKTKE